jgi:type I restriction enzyme, S subunit
MKGPAAPERPIVRLMRADDCLDEVWQGIGPAWSGRPLYGASRSGLTAAKEAIGKHPERYKAVEPGTVFYNPMRILLGSIAMLDEDEAPGITSPDYVVVRGRPGVLHHRVFYYWLRSAAGEQLIRELARGGVRERILFNRLCEGRIPVLPWSVQERLAEQLAIVPRARAAAQARLAAAQALPAAYLREVFEGPEASGWESVRLDETSDLLPSKSISTEGDTAVRAITTACLSERGFLPAGIKNGRMRGADVPDCLVRRGEVLIARSNTPELVGRVAMYDGDPPGVVATDLTIRIWPRQHLHADYLTAFLSYLFQTGYWKARAGGASGTMKKITREQLLAQELRVPPGCMSGNPESSLADQRRIAADLQLRLAVAERLAAGVREELTAIEALPSAFLREAFADSP